MMTKCSLCLLFLSVLTVAPPSARPQSAVSPAPAESFDQPPGETLVLTAHAEGVQIYECTGSTPWAWKFKAPQAKLFDDRHREIGQHFLATSGAGPLAPGPRWRLEDGSEIQGKVVASRPQAESIPWLILAATSTGGAGRLSHVDVVHRVDTHGGTSPAQGCDADHAGVIVPVPYSATYSFYSPQ